MPISEKQLAANRANAKLSHGPTSPEGKRISSRNGAKRSDLSKFVLIEGESPARFDAVLRSYRLEFQPATPAEESFVDSMVITRWHQCRLLALQSAAINYEIRTQCQSEIDSAGDTGYTRAMHAFRTSAAKSPHLELLSRDQARLDRQYNRTLRNLLRFRAEKQKMLENTRQPEENKGIDQ